MASRPEHINGTSLSVDSLPTPEEVEAELLAAPRYPVFAIDQFTSLPLPSGGLFSTWIDRMQGEQCLQVIDANQSGRPDDGDTCIGRNGAFYPEATFTGETLAYSEAGKTCSNLAQWRRFGDGCAMTYDKDLERSLASLREDAVGVTFDVHRPGGAEMFSMSLAGEMQTYGGRMEDQTVAVAEGLVGSVEEHPVAAGAIVTVIGGLIAHPVTRGPTMAVLEWLGIGGAAVGAGGMVYDRVDAVAQYAEDGNVDALEQNMGDHDAEYLLLMSGGMMPGVTVPQAAVKFATGPERAAAALAAGGRRALAAGDEFAAWVLGGGGGGFGLAFEGAGAGGGGVSLSAAAEGVGAIEGGAVVGGAIAPGSMLGPMGPFLMARTAVVQTPQGRYELEIPENFKPTTPWNGEMADLAKQIETWMDAAAAEGPALEKALVEVRSQLRAIQDVYQRTPDEAVRGFIHKALSDVYAGLSDAVESGASYSEIGMRLRDSVYGKFRAILDEVAGGRPDFYTWAKVKPPRFKPPPEGSGIEIHPRAVKEIDASGPIAEKMEDVYDIIDRFRRAGGDSRRIAGDVEPWKVHPKLQKITFQDGPGYRVFFTGDGNGRAVILKAIPKRAPAVEATAAETAWARAREMGYASVLALTVGEGVAEISDVEPKSL